MVMENLSETTYLLKIIVMQLMRSFTAEKLVKPTALAVEQKKTALKSPMQF